ncbi:MAG TPA: AraC family transcriptional regulator [Rhizomicrobium sp.]|jgi:AraC-like DNA-binding protein
MFAETPQGPQHMGAWERHARHRHRGAYAALVLRGGYEESGTGGRFNLHEGDILFHAAFDGYRDHIGASGAEVLNLPLAVAAPIDFALAHHRDFDRVVALAQHDPIEATAMLLDAAEPVAASCADWPDVLVRDLWRDPRLSLSRWSARHGLSPETLSRGLRRSYGVTAAALRGEIRAHRAWMALMRDARPLAQLAGDMGFSDQAHMTRAVARLTGHPPGYWRRQRIH